MTREKVVMSNEHFNYLVDQAKLLGAELISVFGYGEPLMDKGIVDKIQYCTDNGLKTFITTNASLLDVDMTSNLLKAGLRKIRFSVHGTYDNYERVHKGLKWSQVARNIGNFRSVARLRYQFLCDVSVSVIPMHNEDIEYLKEFWKGCELEIWKPHNWSGARKYRKISKDRKKTCGRLHTGPIQIQADGKMIPCCFMTNAEVVLGDTHKNTIEEILKGPLYENMRNMHEKGNLSGLPCETCDQLNIGDSPLLYSTIDPTLEVGKTSSTKFKLKEN